MDLNAQQQAFCQAYARCHVGAKAAREAGYADGRAAERAWMLLRDPDIRARIRELEAAHAITLNLDEDEIVREHLLLAFSDIGDLIDEHGAMLPLQDISPAARRTIASVEITEDANGARVTKLKLWDKNSSLERLARKLGWAQRIDLQARVSLESLLKQVEERRAARLALVPAATGGAK